MQAALQRFGIQPSDFSDILGATQNDFALDGLSRHGQNILMDFFAGAFFKMASTEHSVATHRGTRPGDPLGDLLFNMVFKLIIRDAREVVLAHSDFDWLGTPVSPEDFSQVAPPPAKSFLQIAFVDDLACAFHVPHASQLVSCLSLVTAALHDAARTRGLTLNYKEGKTEAMLNPAGPAARKVRQQLWHQMGGVVPVLVDNEVLQLKLTRTSRHSGILSSRTRPSPAKIGRSGSVRLRRPWEL